MMACRQVDDEKRRWGGAKLRAQILAADKRHIPPAERGTQRVSSGAYCCWSACRRRAKKAFPNS